MSAIASSNVSSHFSCFTDKDLELFNAPDADHSCLGHGEKHSPVTAFFTPGHFARGIQWAEHISFSFEIRNDVKYLGVNQFFLALNPFALTF